MPELPISQIPEKTSLDDADEFALVDSNVAELKRITAVNAGLSLNPIWLDDGTDVTTSADPRNLDLQGGGFRGDSVPFQVFLGDASNTVFNTANKTVTGAVNELKTDLDGLTDELKNLTTAEVQQLENIDTATISIPQWAYMQTWDQRLKTTDDVAFANLRVPTLALANGIVTTDVAGSLGSTTALPPGTRCTTQLTTDDSTLLASTAFVHAEGEGADQFSELTDVTGAYGTAFALYRTKSGINGLEETSMFLTDLGDNQFSLTRGTTSLVMQASITVEGDSAVNQDLTTASVVQLDRLQLGRTGGGEKLNIFEGNIQLDNDFHLRFFDTTQSILSPSIQCDTSNDCIFWNVAGSIVFDQPGSVMIGSGTSEDSAALQLNSTDGALLLPRLTTAERNLLTAVNGMLIYNETDARSEIYQNSSWEAPSGTAEFSNLTDVVGAYTTANAMYATNASVDGLQESTLTLDISGTDRFSFELANGKLDVVNSVFLNQTLRKTDTPSFDGLHLTSTTHGIRVPQMTSAQVDALHEPSGYVVFNTDNFHFNVLEDGNFRNFSLADIS